MLVILIGGVLAGLGSLIRDLTSGPADWTFFLDTIGLIVAVIGAGYDFRIQLRVGEYNVAITRRRGALLLIAGALMTIGGCWVLGWVLTGSSLPILRALLAVVLTSGIGLVVAGMLNIGWFGGGGYLDRRIAQQSDE